MQITLIDNYDSFTYNLYHFLGELGAQVEVYRNDTRTCEEILAQQPDGIVLSPGPCTPDTAGICLDLINAVADIGSLPLLGVCLGHQALGQVFGGKVIPAPHIFHGKTSMVHHDGQNLFKGLKTPMKVTRYHSLILEADTLPSCFTITAKTDDGVIQGIEHKKMPLYGVQFHPESIATENGKPLLKNFLNRIKAKPEKTL